MRRTPRIRPETRAAVSGIVNWRVIGAAVVIASFLLLATILLLMISRPRRAAPSPSTAVVTVIAANTPTFTPEPGAAGAPSGSETALPTPLPGELALGAHVQIVGTGGDGLRLRDQPGLAGKVLIVGSESEVFRIDDGPKELDGYTWWYLVGPFDSNRRGWAVTNYLQLVQNP